MIQIFAFSLCPLEQSQMNSPSPPSSAQCHRPCVSAMESKVGVAAGVCVLPILDTVNTLDTSETAPEARSSGVILDIGDTGRIQSIPTPCVLADSSSILLLCTEYTSSPGNSARDIQRGSAGNSALYPVKLPPLPLPQTSSPSPTAVSCLDIPAHCPASGVPSLIARECCLRRRMKIHPPIPTRAMTSNTTTITAIPAFAPLDRPSPSSMLPDSVAVGKPVAPGLVVTPGVTPFAQVISPPKLAGNVASPAKLLVIHIRPPPAVPVHAQALGAPSAVRLVGPGQPLQRTVVAVPTVVVASSPSHWTRPSSCWFEVSFCGQDVSAKLGSVQPAMYVVRSWGEIGR